MKKPRPIHRTGRKRRTLGWTLITLGVLVAVMWAASGWWWVHYNGGTTWGVGLHQGSASWVFALPAGRFASTGFCGQHIPSVSLADRFVWWTGPGNPNFLSGTETFGIASVARSPTGNLIMLLLWPFPLLLWGAGIPLLRSGILARRRAMTNKCKSCGYDLAGLGADPKCPECGKANIATEHMATSDVQTGSPMP